MRREWKNFHNSQKYSECQLVTALNAYYFLTGKIIKQDSKRYENLVDLCFARYGAAININKVHKKLGLKITKHYISLPNKVRLPLEISVWHKSYGFHSVLIVDFEPKSKACRVTNFKMATNTQGWIFHEDLNHLLRVGKGNSIVNSCPKCDKDKEPRWQYRLFELDKEKKNE